MSIGNLLSNIWSTAKGKLYEAEELKEKYNSYSSQELINMLRNDDVFGVHAMAVRMILKDRGN